MKDKLKGGMSDNKSLQDIADKFNLSVYKIRKELNMGVKIEMEHVNEKSFAREISLDHLIEIPDYYTRLKKMEKEGIKYWGNIKNIKEGFHMGNLKKYTEFINELKSSTWKSAADKALDDGQRNLSNKFSDKYMETEELEKAEKEKLRVEGNKRAWEKRKKENIELQIMDEYTFDYYLDSYDTSEEGSLDWQKVVRMKLGDIDWWNDDQFAFFIDFKTIEGKDLPEVDNYNSVMAFMAINSDPDSGYKLITFNDRDSKFANRKSALMFLKTLEKLYVVQNYNKNAESMAKINNTTVTAVENGGLRRFIDEKFGSWKEFRSKINIRQLYDIY
tara:strand:- start:2120 stop:3112 length:993 start_codon:yes stop_codon:yes gene_type:complete